MEEDRKYWAVCTRRCVPGAPRQGQCFDTVTVLLIEFPAATWLRDWHVIAKADYRMVPWLPCRVPGTPFQRCLWYRLLPVPLPTSVSRTSKAGSHEPAGGCCSPDSPCTISPSQKLCQSYAQKNGMSLLGVWGEWWSLSVGSVSLGTAFGRSFPSFSERQWFGGSIKRSSGVVWMLP